MENDTHGAITDQDAQAWGAAAYRENWWFQWAEANDQYKFLQHIVATNLLSIDELKILRGGGRIYQPGCVLFPLRMRLFPVDSAAQRYLTLHRMFTGAKYVFVDTYRGRCSITYVKRTGERGSLGALTTTVVAFSFGSIQEDDGLLGQLWFQNGYGNCSDNNPNPPADWCRG